MNHNLWVYVRSFLEANELAFMLASEADKAVPQQLIDMCAFIEDILGEECWQSKLKKEGKLLEDVFSKAAIKSDNEMDASRETYVEWQTKGY
jgi:hypothetical protein